MNAVIFLLPFLLVPSSLRAEENRLSGRLFFSSQQRGEIDAFYRNGKNQEIAPPRSLDGEIRRRGHLPTRWIDGAPDTSAIPARVAVGDRYDPNSGRSTPLLGNGRIIVNPPRKP